MKPLTENEISTLQACHDKAEFNAVKTTIMANRDGNLPSDWSEKVIMQEWSNKFVTPLADVAARQKPR